MPERLPEIHSSTKFQFFTSIWIVPFFALIIAGWLAYQYYSERGPEIKIIFPNNQGLKAGQSQIKYKDVPVGTVTKITLQKDGEGVVVIARMDKTARPYLNQNTKFWIVKPQLNIYGVSGLDTLVSGNYIGITGKKGGTFQDTFIGLDHIFLSNKKGEYYILHSQKGESAIKQGTPVYLKNIKVGSVEYVTLGLDHVTVEVIIFIENRYVPYVHSDSKFWVRSTLDAELADGRLDVTLAPISDLLMGAIEFSSSGYDNNRTIPKNFSFQLYCNQNMVNSKKIGHAKKEYRLFELHTTKSIAKLKIGSPVKYEGFHIGSVTEITLFYDKKSHNMRGTIVVEIDTSVFDDPSDANSTGEENLHLAVKEGLRARIDTIDPITERRYVNLLFTDQDGNKSITQGKRYASIPTLHPLDDTIMTGVTHFVEKINRLPIEALADSLQTLITQSHEPVANANRVLKELQATMEDIHTLTQKNTFTHMPDEIDKTLKTLTDTLKTTQKVVQGYSHTSLLSHQVSETLKTVKETSDEMKKFLEMLNRKPNSLIFGDH